MYSISKVCADEESYLNHTLCLIIDLHIIFGEMYALVVCCGVFVKFQKVLCCLKLYETIYTDFLLLLLLFR